MSKHLSNDFDAAFEKSLEDLGSEDREKIVLGDINCDYLKTNVNGKLKRIINSHGFKQLVTSPTQITDQSRSLIDIIATTAPVNIIKISTILSGLSDHDMVGCIQKINNAKYNPRVIKSRNYKNYSCDIINSALEGLSWHEVYDCDDPNNAWYKLKVILSGILDNYAPFTTKRIRGKPCPWLNETLKSEMKYRDSLLRKARKTDKEIDWSAYKRKRNSVNNLLKSAKSKYYHELFEENASSPEKFWKCIKQLFPTKNANGNTYSSMVIDGEKVLDKQVIANGFSNHFFTIAEILKEKLSLLKSTVWAQPVPDKYNTNSVFQFVHVSVPTVMKHLKSLNRKKATGLDDIPPCLLKDGARHIVKPLAHIINRSLATGIVPTEFKCGKIIPIYKSGNQTDIDNYRPITILPAISKVLEKCVYNQTISYLEKNKLLSNQQFGFRKNHSTELAATLFLDNIRKEMDSGKLCGAVFVDLCKAFDTISHSSIVCKLSEYGIIDAEKEWFTNYLFGRTQCVVFDGCTSHVNPVFCGVPQGSILGPLLFLIHFNGVCLPVKNCKI